MPYAKEYWDAEEQARGELWREFVNVLRPYREIGIEAVRAVVQYYVEANRSRSEGSFLSNLPGIWRDPGDRAQIEEDLADMDLGLQIWQRHQHALAGAVSKHDGVSEEVAHARARDAWFSTHHKYAVSDEWMSVLALVHAELHPSDRLPRSREKRLAELYRLMIRLTSELHWIPQMQLLRELARKTWPPDPTQKQPWAYDEFRFCGEYYSDQQPVLEILGYSRDDEFVDPMSLVPVKQEQSVPFSPTLGMNYVGFVIMRAVTIDFVEELLAFNAFESAKGSFQCEECGQFVSRSFYGRGQRYCTAQCKRRAAKRRQREKRRDEAEARAWAERAVDLT